MPKMKTVSGAKKRFKTNKKGKIKYKKSKLRHILSSKSTKAKREMRRPGYVHDADAAGVKRMMPYG